MLQKVARKTLIPLAVVAVAALAGCSAGSVIPTASTETTTAKPAAPPVASIADGATDINPATPVTVKAPEGTLTEVTMTNQDGKVVQAAISEDGHSWSPTEVLGYGRTYTIVATSSNGATLNTSFSTVNPASTTGVALSPLDGSTVGIGQTIQFYFSEAPTDRKAIQDAIQITTTPHVDGAFYWISNRSLRWRPKDYWAPGTQVQVKANIYGLNMGDGLYGDEDNATNFTIGDAVISYADDNTKQLTITKNGEVVKTMPISMGDSQNPTPNGIYTIGDRYDSLVMDSTTFGLSYAAGGYKTTVANATQMSYSGIYVHSAPWSVGQQGYTNVSHGCLNVSPANAQWFKDFSKRGDIVVVSNTIGGTLPFTDGLGDWNVDWATWSAGNA